MRIAALVTAALALVAVIALSAMAYLKHRDGVETGKAQVCVDSGGIPWRPARGANQVCLYRDGSGG